MKKYRPLRQFIYDRLYHPKDGYFCQNDLQLGEMLEPINFKTLIGFDDYQRQLCQKYPKKAWLTPSQIFKPYYGMTIANYIVQAHQNSYPLNFETQKISIVEAGAGTGSAAESILFYLRNYQSKLFANMQYNIVEISPILCQRIQEKLTKSFPKLISNKQIKIFNKDIINFKEEKYCYGLFCQVLDNLPHDKVVWDGQKYSHYTSVDFDTKQEKLQPIQKDPLIQQCLKLYLETGISNKKYQSKGLLDTIANLIVNKMLKSKSKGSNKYQNEDLYLPTYLLKLLRSLKINAPKMNLIISDFDDLISKIPGVNAPIVSTKGWKSNQKKDHTSYLVERGQADIFFPINFPLVQRMHKQVFGKESQIVKSDEFIEQFSAQKWAQTKSGFNPIKEDFNNTSFLVTSIKNLKKQ